MSKFNVEINGKLQRVHTMKVLFNQGSWKIIILINITCEKLTANSKLLFLSVASCFLRLIQTVYVIIMQHSCRCQYSTLTAKTNRSWLNSLKETVTVLRAPNSSQVDRELLKLSLNRSVFSVFGAQQSHGLDLRLTHDFVYNNKAHLKALCMIL